ncbi:isochorismatase family protein [Ruegeria sediminis]|uniref:Isochorismatase family protein n=1 Tax=Ruegeria sediminis TaxID=2583820 RepID=A0ABY2X5J4_9RHOB|nr:isochorismatase family protein [Ruegeria sediminis]TMV10092.1 isochorismatase family protein [Ruegeria sediminis]
MTAKKPTPDNAAMVLIDHQTGTMNWAKSVDRDLIEANTRALARVAVDLGMPLVLTSSMEEHMQGPLMPALEDIAPDAFSARVKRPGVVNAWDDSAFADAVRNTGRKHFIMAGITTDVCLAPPAIDAAAEGFDVTAVVDASGSPTSLTDEMAFRKMERGGVELTTTSALLADLAVNWTSEAGQKIMQVLGEEILSRG